MQRPLGAGRARLRDGRPVRAVRRPGRDRDGLRRLGDLDAAPRVAVPGLARASSCWPCSSVLASPARAARRHLDPPSRLVPGQPQRRRPEALRAHRRTIRRCARSPSTPPGRPGSPTEPEPSGPGELVHVRACGLCGSDVEKLGHRRPPTERCSDTRWPAARRRDARHRDAPRAVRRTVNVAVPARVDVHRVRAAADRSRRLRRALASVARRSRSATSLGELDGIWVEPLACVLRAADRVPRGTVHVVGCGAIGQLWVQVLLRRGDEVDGVGPARRTGARQALRARSLAGRGEVGAAVLTAHAGLECALESLAPGGTLLVFASPAPSALDSALPPRAARRRLPFGDARALRGRDRPAADAHLPPVELLPLERFARRRRPLSGPVRLSRSPSRREGGTALRARAICASRRCHARSRGRTTCSSRSRSRSPTAPT